MAKTRVLLLPKVIGWPLVLIGAATIAGSVWHATLGESSLYVAANVGMAATGGLLARGRPLDTYSRANDVTTGAEVWKDRLLRTGGQASPMTYEGVKGSQHVVGVAGGDGSLVTGDGVIAHALRP